jgi:hypothetical protein
MDPNQIMLGKYSLPFILSMILGLIYKRASIADDLKPYIAAACGVALGIAAMFYNEATASINFGMVADYVLAGGMGGAASTGIYEMTKESGAGRTYIAVDADNKRIPGAKVAKISKIKIMR